MTGARMAVTFESESAGFHNTLGYFLKDTGEAEIVFADIDDRTLSPGTTEIFDLTSGEYQELEFFLIADGATKNAELFSNLDVLDLVVEETTTGFQVRDQNTDTVLKGYVYPTYVSEKSGYPDGIRHALQVGDLEDYTLLWEDLPDGGDNDYNDTIVSVEFTPEEILESLDAFM